MAVSFVASTQLTLANNEAESGTNTFVTASTPAGIQDDDTVLALLFARSTITPPSGWTLIGTSTILSGFGNQRAAVYSKNTVTSADSSTAFTFNQSSDSRMGLVFGVFRGVDTITDFQHNNTTDADTYTITPPTVTATDSGEMIVCAGATYYGAGSVTPTVPTSFTKFSGATLTDYRLATAYREVNSGQSNSGSFNLAPGASSLGTNNGLIGISLRLLPPAAPTISGRVAAATPLGSPSVLAAYSTAARVSVSTPLGAARVSALHDFTVKLDDSARTLYVMDLVTPGGLVRVPISSWQATLQTDIQSYVQCVVPAATDWVPDIEAATEFIITRRGTLLDGSTFEYEMTRAPAQTVSLDGGAYNYTATISGYVDALTAVEDPPTALDRHLAGVRTVSRNSGNVRVRCNIDWLLRPGHRAYLDDEPIVVAYVNYYVPGFDQYMDVGDGV